MKNIKFISCMSLLVFFTFDTSRGKVQMKTDERVRRRMGRFQRYYVIAYHIFTSLHSFACIVTLDSSLLVKVSNLYNHNAAWFNLLSRFFCKCKNEKKKLIFYAARAIKQNLRNDKFMLLTRKLNISDCF